MIQSFLCIPHIPVGHAGGRATQEQLPRTLMTQMIMMNTDNPNGLAVSTRFNCVFQDNSRNLIQS